ncbi:ATP-grasp domain-containing protein [Archaeoglobus neptunius]|uniref:ATP-grasp domain-containing protein n=1 Tax=Archaeoglobus neptunius TaxID=2798580 RepID=UPI001927E4CE|nr:ATP-grasp domain-containing protein [Archaeoglobus neptunius]
MSEKVLLAGTNVRNVAESARKTGWEVYALTKFADADLQIYCNEIFSIDDDAAAELVEAKAEELGAKIVLCSGFETLNVKGEFLCNDPQTVLEVTDKLRFYRRLERAGLPFPELLSDDESGIVKPRRGGGGEEVRISKSVPKGYVKQKFIRGLPCSVSLIASEGKAVPIACNLIYAGWDKMNAGEFRYSGNLTPLVVAEEKRKKLEELAVEVVELFDLSGSVGVDFVLSDKPYILEINPRFQGSLDSIEWSCDVNVFEMHAGAFNGKVPEKPRPKRFAIRAVLFSPRDMKIRTDFTGNPFFADVPNKGELYRREDPLVSILAAGDEVKAVERKIVERRDLFLSLA